MRQYFVSSSRAKFGLLPRFVVRTARVYANERWSCRTVLKTVRIAQAGHSFHLWGLRDAVSRFSPPCRNVFFSRSDWDLGRPPRKGADAAREHFYRYTQRHCMVFPDRSPADVVERLKLMFRYNALKVNGAVGRLHRVLAQTFFWYYQRRELSLPAVGARAVGLSDALTRYAVFVSDAVHRAYISIMYVQRRRSWKCCSAYQQAVRI